VEVQSSCFVFLQYVSVHKKQTSSFTAGAQEVFMLNLNKSHRASPCLVFFRRIRATTIYLVGIHTSIHGT
jgi:hypothetical protein